MEITDPASFPHSPPRHLSPPPPQLPRHQPQLAMDSVEDEDVRLQRASAGLLSTLRTSLDKVLWKTSKNTGQRQLHRGVRQNDLNRLISLVGAKVTVHSHATDRLLQDRTVPGRASAA